MQRFMSYLKKAGLVIAALLMTVAPCLNMRSFSTFQPLFYGTSGHLFQLMSNFFSSLGIDSVTAVFVMMATYWLARRYLFHKPAGTKTSEYILCAVFSVMMLLASTIRNADTMAVLGANPYQPLKMIPYLCGMFCIFLCSIRALNELLVRKPWQKKVGLWQKHPFWFPFVALCIAWLPHVVIKYPGVLWVDSGLSLRMYLGLSERTNAHPPFGTLIFGLMGAFGQKTGQYNLIYFVYTFIQTACFIAVLSYSLWLMEKRNVPFWVKIFTLLLYAISPIYVGWTTVMLKDSSYLILCMLAGVLLMEFIVDSKAFLHNRKKLALLFVCLLFMMAVRHNGITIAVPMILAMGITAVVKGYGFKPVVKLLVIIVSSVMLVMGMNEAITRALDMNRDPMYDWLSIPFQQTARVVKLHPDEITEEEKEAINQVMAYDEIADAYEPNIADSVKWTFTSTRTFQGVKEYLAVWWSQMKRYPLNYLDALLEMDAVYFDLQSNFPLYAALTNTEITPYVYFASFIDMSFYNADSIASLHGWQLLLTEYYYRFSSIPVIGLFASMGFCNYLMISMIYLSVVHRRKRALFVYIPSIVVSISALMCSIPYTRYMLPTMGAIPLWMASFYLAETKGVQNEALAPKLDRFA